MSWVAVKETLLCFTWNLISNMSSTYWLSGHPHFEMTTDAQTLNCQGHSHYPLSSKYFSFIAKSYTRNLTKFIGFNFDYFLLMLFHNSSLYFINVTQ